MKYGERVAEPQKRQGAKSASRVTGSARKQVSAAHKPCVYVGMSGGVDSSVTAALLKKQGYNVVGVFMKNWTQDLPGVPCTWQEDFQDAKRVAVQLGLDFKVYDFQGEYRQSVVDYMLREYRAGRTPNPDIMCNQEIKFKLFIETAIKDGADLIATGHYARINSAAQLLTARNSDKDQSYFLYRVTENALARSLMPIGEYKTKADVRAVAKKLGLATAEKKDSQGICFVGKVGIKDFLLYEIGPQAPGEIYDQHGQKIGMHEGAIFYTIGQRHGLDVGGGLPYYVTGKNMPKNEIYVTSDIQDENLWRQELALTDIHWINGAPDSGAIKVRLRYRSALIGCKLNGNALQLDEPARAVTAGQSAVFYQGERCLGGGIVVSGLN